VYNISAAALKAKWLYHDRRYRNLITFITFLHITLGVFEGKDSDYSISHWGFFAETLFLLTYMADSLLVRARRGEASAWKSMKEPSAAEAGRLGVRGQD
jgi:hypothetical protein